MGAILAILGPQREGTAGQLEKMIASSPYRGVPECSRGANLALAVQRAGKDADLAKHGPWVIALHGFIGNWPELARAHGCKFPDDAGPATKVAMAFEALGENLFAKLRGEFSILIHDTLNETVLAVRDAVGCRPLFWERKGEHTYIASEIRQVLAGSGSPKRLNEEVIVRWILHRYELTSQTPCQNVSRFLPGRIHLLNIRDPLRTHSNAFWSPPKRHLKPEKSVQAYAEELKELLRRALLRTIPSVPVAVQLSGGLDSGLIWSLLAEETRKGRVNGMMPTAVSLVYPGKSCDEQSYIEALHHHLGTEGYALDVSNDRPLRRAGQLAAMLDNPFVLTLAQFEQVFTSARDSGACIVLNGIGGDEWLGGDIYQLGALLRRLEIADYLRSLRRMTKSARTALSVTARALVDFRPPSLFRSRPDLPDWLRSDWIPGDKLSSELAEDGDCRAWPLSLLRVHQSGAFLDPLEQMGAVHGVETRLPLMDLDLIEFSFRIAGDLFLHGGIQKGLLRLAMKGLMPATVLNRRSKTAFDDVVDKADVEFVTRSHPPAEWSLVTRGIISLDKTRELMHESGAGSLQVPVLVSDLIVAEHLATNMN